LDVAFWLQSGPQAEKVSERRMMAPVRQDLFGSSERTPLAKQSVELK